MSSRCRAILLLALVGAIATGCGEDDPARDRAAAAQTELVTLGNAITAAEADATAFLISSPQASSCLRKEESESISRSYDALAVAVGKEVEASRSLAEEGEIDKRFNSSSEQASALDVFISEVTGRLEAGKKLNELIKQSTGDLEGFRKRADKAWYRVLGESNKAQPWLNKGIASGDAGAKADAGRMTEFIGDAKRFKANIDAGWAKVVTGQNYDCTDWVLSFINIEITAARTASLAAGLRKIWAPAPDDN